MRDEKQSIDKAYLKIILIQHVGVDMGLTCTIDRGSLSLEWRRRLVVPGGPLPFLHLDQSRGRKGGSKTPYEGHQGFNGGIKAQKQCTGIKVCRLKKDGYTGANQGS